MAVRLIPCRRRDDHTVTTEIPETGLRHMPAFEPIDEDDRKRLGYDKPAETPAGGEPDTAPKTTPKSKPAAGGAKTSKENRDGD